MAIADDYRVTIPVLYTANPFTGLIAVALCFTALVYTVVFTTQFTAHQLSWQIYVYYYLFIQGTVVIGASALHIVAGLDAPYDEIARYRYGPLKSRGDDAGAESDEDDRDHEFGRDDVISSDELDPEDLEDIEEGAAAFDPLNRHDEITVDREVTGYSAKDGDDIHQTYDLISSDAIKKVKSRAEEEESRTIYTLDTDRWKKGGGWGLFGETRYGVATPFTEFATIYYVWMLLLEIVALAFGLLYNTAAFQKIVGGMFVVTFGLGWYTGALSMKRLWFRKTGTFDELALSITPLSYHSWRLMFLPGIAVTGVLGYMAYLQKAWAIGALAVLLGGVPTAVLLCGAVAEWSEKYMKATAAIAFLSIPLLGLPALLMLPVLLVKAPWTLPEKFDGVPEHSRTRIRTSDEEPDDETENTGEIAHSEGI